MDIVYFYKQEVRKGEETHTVEDTLTYVREGKEVKKKRAK